MHEVKWRGGSTLKPYLKFIEARVSKHKRSHSDPVLIKVEKPKLNNMFEASHKLEKDKMEPPEDSVEARNRVSPNTKIQDSLKEEIIELQDQLRDQFEMHHALEKAMNYVPFPYDTKNDGSIPKATKELIKEIAVLELEVIHLERYLLSLYRDTFDQQFSSQQGLDEICKNSITHKRMFPAVPRQDITTDNHNSVNQSSHLTFHQNSKGNQPMECNGSWGPEKLLDSSIHQYQYSVSHRSIGSPSSKSVSRAVDLYHSLPLSMLEHAQNNDSNASLADYLGTNTQDYVFETPNLISEEMIKCISSIYCDLADPPLIGRDYPSPISFSSSQIELPAQGQCEMWSFHCGNFPSANLYVDNPFHIGASKELNGPYCTMAMVQWINRDSEKLKDVQQKLQDFRSLVSKLEAVDPRKLKHEEKLAFWINVHNALVMHAFLVYGIPHSNMKRMSLILKAAYNVGGHTVNIDMIQNSILGCHLLRPGQWLRHLFSSKPKFKVGDPRKLYSIKHPEPRLHFALSAGCRSDPAVRVYTPKRVFEDLEAAMEEYVQSNLIIYQDKKLHLPKLVECFAKELDLCPDGLLHMIEHLLPNSLRKSIQDFQYRKSGRSIEWIHHNFAFRYLLSKELVQ